MSGEAGISANYRFGDFIAATAIALSTMRMISSAPGQRIPTAQGSVALKTASTLLQTSVTPLQALNPELQKSLIAQRKYLLTEGVQNWDGYGALPISAQTIDRLYSDLSVALAGVDCSPPDIIPGGDGSIQAEWHRRGLTVLYKMGADGARYIAILRPHFSDIEAFEPVTAIEALNKWAPRLARTQVMQLAG